MLINKTIPWRVITGIRLDTPEREDNLMTAQRWYFDRGIDLITKIIPLNASWNSGRRVQTWINEYIAAELTDNLVLTVLSDMLIYPPALRESYKLCAAGAVMVLPFDGRVKERGVTFMLDSVGCAFTIHVGKYIAQAGGENPFLPGWGYDDYERYLRVTRLCGQVQRVKGFAVHTPHTRPRYADQPQIADNRAEYEAVMAMTDKELREYANSFNVAHKKPEVSNG